MMEIIDFLDNISHIHLCLVAVSYISAGRERARGCLTPLKDCLHGKSSSWWRIWFLLRLCFTKPSMFISTQCLWGSQFCPDCNYQRCWKQEGETKANLYEQLRVRYYDDMFSSPSFNNDGIGQLWCYPFQNIYKPILDFFLFCFLCAGGCVQQGCHSLPVNLGWTEEYCSQAWMALLQLELHTLTKGANFLLFEIYIFCCWLQSLAKNKDKNLLCKMSQSGRVAKTVKNALQQDQPPFMVSLLARSLTEKLQG